MERFAAVLAEAGGEDAPATAIGRLRTVLHGELERGAVELTLKHSGYDGLPLAVIFAAVAGGLRAALPIDPAFRADPAVVGERAFLLAVATAGALVTAGVPPASLGGGEHDGFLLLGGPAPADADVELATLALTDTVEGIDRLRAEGLAVPAAVLPDSEPLRAPVGTTHPLRVAAEIAAAGGNPTAPDHDVEDAVLAALGDADGVARPHDDPDPARRAARRILQRMNGMGKWGGYHTEFVHLARGFEGNERQRAEAVGEALVAAGLLGEKVSVGQRHVYLDPRRKADIHALMDRGELPPGLHLP